MLEKGDVHYQDVQFDEVRDLGTGYFAFSRSERERERQKEDLTEIREETLTAREKAEKIKAKRAEMMKARLAKVKVRIDLLLRFCDYNFVMKKPMHFPADADVYISTS